MIYMAEYVSTFQLGSSTVVTLPKKLGIKPGQKMEIKKARNGLTLKLSKKESLVNILRKTQGLWADMDWKEYDKKEKERRRFELAAAKKMKEAW